MMSENDTDRAALQARLTSIAQREGLKVKDTDALVSAALESGISLWFHGASETDDTIADKLHILASKRRELFEAPAAALADGPSDQAFVAWLGNRAQHWSTLSPQAKLMLTHQFKASQTSTARPTVADEMSAKYGSPEAAEKRMTATERLKMAHASNSTAKASRPTTVAPLPAMAGLTGQAKLAALDAQREYARLGREIDGLRKSTGGELNVRMARDTAMRVAEQKRVSLRERWGGVLV
jgi:hypothetical protein